MHYDVELDTSGQLCPFPLIAAKAVLYELESKQIIKLISTDPHSKLDFEVFARQSGNPLLQWTQEEEKYIFFLQKR